MVLKIGQALRYFSGRCCRNSLVFRCKLTVLMQKPRTIVTHCNGENWLSRC